jgi:predicted nucleotidyltransferase
MFERTLVFAWTSCYNVEQGAVAMDKSRAGATPVKVEAPEVEFAEYLPHIRRRWLAQRAAAERRREEAWAAAREAAALLRLRFGAARVVAFGSLVHPGFFSECSDIDVAVSGVPPAAFFEAWAAAGGVCPCDLDLVDLRDCSPGLRRLIDEEGIDL